MRACLVHVCVKNGRDRRRSPGARAGAPCTLFEQAKKKKTLSTCFIPKTLCEDNDPLDILVLMQVRKERERERE